MPVFDLKLTHLSASHPFTRQLPLFNWHYPFDAPTVSVPDPLLPLTGPRASQRRSLYFHIPFCETICSFCPFRRELYHSASDLSLYVDTLLQEIALKSSYLGRCAVDAIFVGGGSPSILTPEQIRSLGRAINDHFDLATLAEFTFEIEVKSVTREKLSAMKDIGVNRISFGAQTFLPRYRDLFGLSATVEQIFLAAALIREMFPYVNVDMLYGMAGQSLEELARDVYSICSLNTTTIDFYPINNFAAPPVFHKQIREAGLPYLSATVRHQYRVKIHDIMSRYGHVPISGYCYSLEGAGLTYHGSPIQHNPKFLYHDMVYGHHDDEILGYGAAAISQLPGYNLYNSPDLHTYAEAIGHDRLCHQAFATSDCPERGIVLFPYRGEVEKLKILWDKIPRETADAFVSALERGLILEHPDRYVLSPLGWLYYVDLMYYLMPTAGKQWLTNVIEMRTAAGRTCGDTELVSLR